MVMLRHSQSGLEERLEALEPWQRAAFALACAQRALPLYLAYAPRFPHGDAPFANSAVSQIWSSLEVGQQIAPPVAERMIAMTDAALPPHIAPSAPMMHWYAEAAMIALAHALRCQLPGDRTRDALASGSQLRHLLTIHIETRDKLDYNIDADRERLDNDPLMQAELSRQQADLSLLVGGLRQAETIRHLRERAEREPVIEARDL
jgi:uncharacterized protein YjaG (DUF416 family)